MHGRKKTDSDTFFRLCDTGLKSYINGVICSEVQLEAKFSEACHKLQVRRYKRNTNPDLSQGFQHVTASPVHEVRG